MGHDFSGLMAKKPAPKKADDRLMNLAVDQIEPDPNNVRRVFDSAKLEELAASMKARGQLQPVVVKPLEGDRYRLIAGERRWRAAKIAKLETVLAIRDDRKVDAQREIDQLVENMQRENLKPSEIIPAMVAAKESGLKAIDIAKLSGLSKQMVGKYLKLGQNPDYIEWADSMGVKAAYERVLEETGQKKDSSPAKPTTDDKGEGTGDGGRDIADKRKTEKVQPLSSGPLEIEIDGTRYKFARAWVVDEGGAERPVLFD